MRGKDTTHLPSSKLLIFSPIKVDYSNYGKPLATVAPIRLATVRKLEPSPLVIHRGQWARRIRCAKKRINELLRQNSD